MNKKFILSTVLLYISLTLFFSCKKSDDLIIENVRTQVTAEDTIAWPKKGWFFIGIADGEKINYQTVENSFARGMYGNSQIYVMRPQYPGTSDNGFARQLSTELVRFSWGKSFGYEVFDDTSHFISQFIARDTTEVKYNFVDTTYNPSQIQTTTVYQFSEIFTRESDGKQILIEGTFGAISWY